MGHAEFCDDILALTCPTLLADEGARPWFANWLRAGASPAMGYEPNRAFEQTDMSDVYAAVRVPALVLYRETPVVPETSEESLAVAALVPDSRSMRISRTGYRGFFLSPEIAARSSGSSRRELARFRGEERDTAGDGFFATFDGPARAVRCARAAIEAVRPLGLELRAGIHTGECELHERKVAGVALAIGARVCDRGRPRRGARLAHGQGSRGRSRSRLRGPRRHGLKEVGAWEPYAVVWRLRLFPDHRCGHRPFVSCITLRRWVFLGVYHVLLPVGYAQAWLAERFRRIGIELGWPLLIFWWPLRQIYAAGFRLCVVLRP
jgi:hypothetical protein